MHVPDQIDSDLTDDDLTGQPGIAVDREALGGRRPVVAGATAGMWGLFVGVAIVTCLVMLVWAVSPNSTGDSAAAWRAAGTTWLGAHLVPLTFDSKPLTLLPLGGLLLGLLLTRRSGAWTGRMLPEPTRSEAAGIVLGSALVYGTGGACIAWLSGTAVPARAFLVTGMVAAIGTCWGIAQDAGLVAAARARVSEAVWRTGLAGLTAVVAVLAAGALLVSLSLVRHFSQVGGTLADLDPGLLGAAGVTLLGALSLPTLAVWAMSVIVGPGFSLGPIGGLSAFGGEVGSLPALPVLAAIPTTVPSWAPLLLILPVLAGVLAGRIRWGRDLPTLTGTASSAAGLFAVVAALVAVLVGLASGSLGGGELSDVGPSVLPVSAAAAALVVLGFVAEATFQTLRLNWELHQAEQRAAAGIGADADLVDASMEGVDEAEASLLIAEAEDDGPAGPSLDPRPPAGPAARGRVPAGAASLAGSVAGAGTAGISLLARAVGSLGARQAPAAEASAKVSTDLAADPDVIDEPSGEAVDVRDSDELVDLRDDGATAASIDEALGTEAAADEAGVEGASVAVDLRDVDELEADGVVDQVDLREEAQSDAVDQDSCVADAVEANPAGSGAATHDHRLSDTAETADPASSDADADADADAGPTEPESTASEAGEPERAANTDPESTASADGEPGRAADTEPERAVEPAGGTVAEPEDVTDPEPAPVASADVSPREPRRDDIWQAPVAAAADPVSPDDDDTDEIPIVIKRPDAPPAAD